MKKFTLLLCPFLFANYFNINAQCSSGETPVEIQITTDQYGYEGFWALYPQGGSCANNIASGGNVNQVGCNGAGVPYSATPGGSGVYPNNQTVSGGSFCLVTGATYNIEYVDDYLDGGFKFTVLINGLAMYRFEGNGNNDVFTFSATPPPALDAGINQILTGNYYSTGEIPIIAQVFNYGATIINTVMVNYSINNGDPVSQQLSGLSIFPYSDEHVFTFNTPWSVTDTGVYSLKIWTNTVNGQTDLNSVNDHIEKTVIIGKAVPNLIDQYLTKTLDYAEIGNVTDGLNKPRDLDFHPVLRNYELWVVNEDVVNTGGSTVTFFNAGMTDQMSVHKRDGNAWHFMSLPTGIAFSENTNFANSTGVLDANHGNGRFTGPALWSSDMAIYAEPSGGNGSHLDMLHQSPYAMGIAAEKENAFWVFDGYAGNIVRYDFVEDHGPGNSDHSDGIVWRYTEVEVQKLNDIPSHLVLDEQKKWLYIVDGGNQRILRMDITTGSAANNLTPYAEPLAEYKRYEGVTWEVLVTSGLVEPCGIDIIDDRLIVSDHSNGDIIIYDISVQPVVELGRVQTGQPGIQGIKIGPDGKIWFVNRTENRVMRIDGPEEEAPVNTKVNELQPRIGIFPNPATEQITVRLSDFSPDMQTIIKVTDLAGKNLIELYAAEQNQVINFGNFPQGNYILSVINPGYIKSEKIIIVK